jgi:hypothetical protein
MTFGTGAFSASRISERNIDIKIVDDSAGLVGLVSNPDVSGVGTDGGELSIYLSDSGVNASSIYQFGFLEEEMNLDSSLTSGNFPYLAEKPEDLSQGASGDPFKSAFAVANHTDDELGIEFTLDIDTADTPDTVFAFEIHRDGSRRGLIQNGTSSETVTTTLTPGEAFGVSFIISTGEDALGDSLSGTISVKAGEAV